MTQLTKERIESLGWKFDIELTEYSSRYKTNLFGLTYNTSNNRIRIWELEKQHCFFDWNTIDSMEKLILLMGLLEIGMKENPMLEKIMGVLNFKNEEKI